MVLPWTLDIHNGLDIFLLLGKVIIHYKVEHTISCLNVLESLEYIHHSEKKENKIGMLCLADVPYKMLMRLLTDCVEYLSSIQRVLVLSRLARYGQLQSQKEGPFLVQMI